MGLIEVEHALLKKTEPVRRIGSNLRQGPRAVVDKRKPRRWIYALVGDLSADFGTAVLVVDALKELNAVPYFRLIGGRGVGVNDAEVNSLGKTACCEAQ